jgi:hypothetical protein
LEAPGKVLGHAIENEDVVEMEPALEDGTAIGAWNALHLMASRKGTRIAKNGASLLAISQLA